jgi:hypothetical protein
MWVVDYTLGASSLAYRTMRLCSLWASAAERCDHTKSAQRGQRRRNLAPSTVLAVPISYFFNGREETSDRT